MRNACVLFVLVLVLTAVSAVAQVPVVNHVWPGAGLNRQAVTAHLYGNNYLLAPPSFRLVRSGFPDISGTSVQVLSDDYATCSFSLNGRSAGLYDLVSTNIFGQDTILGCFTVYSKSYSPVAWVPVSIGWGDDSFMGITVGDGDRDGDLEVYGACADDSLYQFEWDGSMWNKSLVGPCTWSMLSVVVGDGNGDTQLDIYAGALDGVLYQFQWNGSSWNGDTVGEAWEGVTGVAIGDGNNDLTVELYASGEDDTLYTFEWDGMYWIDDMIGSGGDDLTGVVVADGDNDRLMEVYVSCLDNNIYEFVWNGAVWQRNTVGSGGAGMLGVAVGDGNGDGVQEVYGACADDSVYQFKWNGVTYVKTTVGFCSDAVSGVAVGDGDGDGSREVYVSSWDMGVYEYKWNGVSWLVDSLGEGYDQMFSVAVGDGNNDGKMEVYGGNNDTEVWEFSVIKLPDIELSDLSHDFGLILVGDSLDWTNFKVRNVGTSDLIVGGIVSDTSAFAVISPSFADTIVPDDSSFVTVRFRAFDMSVVVGSLAVFSNDPDESPVYVTVTGGGHGGSDIALSDTSYDFGTVNVGDSLDWSSLTIYNVGLGPLSVDSLVTDLPAYRVIGFAAPDTVLPGDSTIVGVRFKPSVYGPTDGILSIHSNDLGAPVFQVALYGAGGDVVPPLAFSLIAPPDSAILTTARPTFIWEASTDALSGLRDYELYIDASLAQTTVDTTWLADFDLTESWHDWYAVAYDSAGNSTQSSETWWFGIDISAPVIESTTVWMDTASAGPFEILTKVTDAMAGVDSVRLYYRRDEDPSWVLKDMLTGAVPDWFVDSIPPVSTSNDTVRYYIEATDAADPAHVGTDPVGAPGTCYWFLANTVGIQELRVTPGQFSFAVKRNPARDRIVFGLSIPASGQVSLKIYDTSGRLVDEPLAGKSLGGSSEIRAREDLRSGIYFYRLESPWGNVSGKLVLIR
jgi:hypothetical protein